MPDEQMREYQEKLSSSCPFEILAATLGELWQTDGETAIELVNRELRVNPLTCRIRLTRRLPPMRKQTSSGEANHPLATTTTSD